MFEGKGLDYSLMMSQLPKVTIISIGTIYSLGYWPQATEQLLLSQQSWLLKAVATELRLTSVNRQRSHTQRLVQLLLDDNPSTQGRREF